MLNLSTILSQLLYNLVAHAFDDAASLVDVLESRRDGGSSTSTSTSTPALPRCPYYLPYSSLGLDLASSYLRAMLSDVEGSPYRFTSWPVKDDPDVFTLKVYRDGCVRPLMVVATSPLDAFAQVISTFGDVKEGVEGLLEELDIQNYRLVVERSTSKCVLQVGYETFEGEVGEVLERVVEYVNRGGFGEVGI